MAMEHHIQRLIHQSLALGLIENEDQIYVRNRIMARLGLDAFTLDTESDHLNKVGVAAKDLDAFTMDAEPYLNEKTDPLEALIQEACEQGMIGNADDEKDILAGEIMDCFIPRPSEVNRAFFERYRHDPKEATDYFYQLSQNSRYIKMKEVRKNINYKVSTVYGALDITINLSKPEKDPKAISKAKATKSPGYPKCLLCVENEGFLGRIGHPARSQHRTVRVQLAGECWHFQYSPYVYYNEHCILLSETHRPMKIDAMTFRRLLDFVRQFPHYFLGSNADLPIVGGSILAHDHYQGGNYTFAMAKAEADYHFRLKAFPHVAAAIVRWPMPVIRLQGEDAEALAACADFILEQWKTYNDPSVDILAFTDATPHNTITPIARIRKGRYELDLVLRNNRTNAEHPLGIFHPHEDVHHIKKENIGLIEVMGLAVLPARLKEELEHVENYLLDRPNDIKDYHVPWANHMKEIYRDRLTETSVREIVRHEVGMKFLRVLEDAAVFKRDEKGKAALKRFIREQLKGEVEA